MKFFLGFVLCLISLQGYTQEKCAFVAVNKQLSDANGAAVSDPTFEKWMQLRKMDLRGAHRTAGSTAGVAKYVIPVVVHVIHHGEALGTAANIPKEQILSQIKILNDDFRALNSSDINKLSTQFKSLVADTEIEFVLAKQDPEGVETDGIIRVASSKQSWNQDQDIELKSLSQWPSDKYLNLYSADLSYPTLGWAQFPQSTQLQGLNIGDVSEASDGVVIDYRYLGVGYRAVSGSRGRTATHEIGHYFGLRHIWGDGGCNVDDYVSDTPITSKEFTGCPSTDTAKDCGSNPAMFQNYMDYTNDDCMALFTLGQKERMMVVLQYSPRRKELHNSPGKQAPTVAANDAGIRSLVAQPGQNCNGTYIPTVEVRNYGSNPVNEVKVALSLDNQPLQTYTLATNLAPLESKSFQLEEISIGSSGTRMLSASVTLTNASTDGKASNNTASTEVFVPLRTTLPLSQNFEGGFLPFYVQNPDKSYGWEMVTAPNGNASNKAPFLNFFDYPAEGQRDILVSPILDLSNETNLYLAMRVAYARYDNRSTDGLEIYVSTDCKGSLQNATLVHKVSGEALASAPMTSRAFVPRDASQWSTLGIDLSAYAGLPNVQLLIVGVNQYGNNLYVDDIQLDSSPVTPLNASLRKIIAPSPVFGSSEPPLQVRIKNSGKESIETLSVKITLNGSALRTVQLQNMGLMPLDERTYSLGKLTELGDGPHILQLQAFSPNGGIDGISSDDKLSLQFVVSHSQRPLPLLEKFNATTFQDNFWTSSSTDFNEQGWITTNVPGPQAENSSSSFASMANFSGQGIPTDKWLASPIFNLRHTQNASMQFWYYAGGTGNLSLKVLASLDGGLSWDEVLWHKEGKSLKSDNPPAASQPALAADWTRAFINLKSLTGNESVRLAFVATGQLNTVVYVDEIGIFLSSQPTNVSPKDVHIYPNPTSSVLNLAFNMQDENPADDKNGEDVEMALFSSQGVLIGTKVYPNTTNQIYTQDLQGLPAGIYYIRIRSKSLSTTRKVVLTR